MPKQEKKKMRYSVRGKKSRFFNSEGVDELVSICMVLAQELWVVKEQLAAYKALAIEKDSISVKDIQNYQFSPKQRAELDQESQAFIDRIFFALREKVEGIDADIDEPQPPTIP